MHRSAQAKTITSPDSVKPTTDLVSQHALSRAPQVNAILPLCIGGPHGAIALQRLREVLGWVVTLDPLGFTGEQARVVPFLVLAAAARQLPPGTERGEVVWNMLQETCLAVYYRYNMKDQVNL